VWVRFFDIPVGMLTDSFVRAFGGKLGPILELGDATKDFEKSEKINFLCPAR
jgi:hypothetical protein